MILGYNVWGLAADEPSDLVKAPMSMIPAWKPVAFGLAVIALLTMAVRILSARSEPDRRYRLEVRLAREGFTGLVEVVPGGPSDPSASTEFRSMLDVDGRGRARIANLGAVVTLPDDSGREVECVYPSGRRISERQADNDDDILIRRWPFASPGRGHEGLTFFVGRKAELDRAVRAAPRAKPTHPLIQQDEKKAARR